MKMYCAITAEMDDADIAVAEITDQLKNQGDLKKNSVGLIAMFADFYDTGVYSAIVNALPFPCIAYSSSFSGANGEAADGILSVVVLTSDDNTFEVFKTDKLDTFNDPEGTKRAVEAAAEQVYSKGTPSLIMPYWGIRPTISSDDLLTLFDEAFHQTPLFGSVIFSTLGGMFSGFTCLGDSDKCEDSVIFAAVYGPLNPHFIVASGINESVKLHTPAKVTKAVSSTLYEVNNITVMDYLKKIGVIDESFTTDTMWVFPSRVENPENGTSKVRAFVGISPDCPTAFYATGNIEEGKLISFGQLDAAATNASAIQAFNTVIDDNANCFLGLSCVARSWANGMDYLKEFKDIAGIYEDEKDNKGRTLNYQIINSGGEICPVPDKDGKLVNTLHNYTLAMCYFND
jgi:hypothetical protein